MKQMERLSVYEPPYEDVDVADIYKHLVELYNFFSRAQDLLQSEISKSRSPFVQTGEFPQHHRATLARRDEAAAKLQIRTPTPTESPVRAGPLTTAPQGQVRTSPGVPALVRQGSSFATGPGPTSSRAPSETSEAASPPSGPCEDLRSRIFRAIDENLISRKRLLRGRSGDSSSKKKVNVAQGVHGALERLRAAEVDMASRPLVISMQSSVAMRQMQRLFLAAGSLGDVAAADQGVVDESPFGRIGRLLRKLSELDRKESLAQHLERRCHFLLYRETVRLRPPGLTCAVGGHYRRWAEMCGMKQSSFCVHVEVGKKLYLLCGGHIGLLGAIPMDNSINDKVFVKQNVRNTPMPEAQMIAEQLADNAWARAVCSLGQALDEHLLDSSSSPPHHLSTAFGSALDVGKLSRAEIDLLLDPFVVDKCTCELVG